MLWLLTFILWKDIFSSFIGYYDILLVWPTTDWIGVYVTLELKWFRHPWLLISSVCWVFFFSQAHPTGQIGPFWLAGSGHFKQLLNHNYNYDIYSHLYNVETYLVWLWSLNNRNQVPSCTCWAPGSSQYLDSSKRKPSERSWVSGCHLHLGKNSACCWAKYAASPAQSVWRQGWASPWRHLVRSRSSRPTSGPGTSWRGSWHTSATPWTDAHEGRRSGSVFWARVSEPDPCSWCWPGSSPIWPRLTPPDPSWTRTSAPMPSPSPPASPPPLPLQVPS